MSVSDWSINVSDFDVTAQVSSSIHPSPVKSGSLLPVSDGHCLLLKCGGG